MKTETAGGRRQLAAWAGMMGPILFVAVFTLEGWLRPGYDARGMFVSELALGPRGWIQIVNFIVFGLLFLLFTRGVAAEFPEGKASRAGPVLLTIIGISLLASGIFVMDPVTTPPDQMSWHGRLHNLFGAIVFLLMPLSCFVFLRRFRVDAKWRSLRWWTLAAGTITAVLLIVWTVGAAEPPAPPTIFNAWTGFMQRAILVTYLSWQFAFAWELGRQKQTASAFDTKMKASNSVQKLYTERASLYERLFIDFLGWGKQLQSFFKNMDYLQPDVKILDAGCGTGIITRVLYQHAQDKGYQGIQFHAFDLTPNMLDLFQEWVAQHEASNVELCQADVLEIEILPSNWKAYDMVVSSTMLEYLPTEKVQQALHNLKQLLKSEGILLIFVTRRNLITRWLAEKWWKTKVYEEMEIRSILHELGFSQITFRKLSPGWSGSIMVVEAGK